MPLSVKDKIFARDEYGIESADIHPTEPWLLTGHWYNQAYDHRSISIFNLESGAIIHTYEVTDVQTTRTTLSVAVSVVCVKFIARKNWFAASASDGVLYIFDYNTHESVVAVDAHARWARRIAVHPTSPIILTGGDDQTIKAWDWDKQWGNIQTYRSHTYCILSIAFHPKDSNVFVSTSQDGTVKIWSIDAPVPKLTMKGPNSGITCIGFYPGVEKLYLITASNRTIDILDYTSGVCVQSIEGHIGWVHFAALHPNLPIIISGSDDGIVKVWNCETYTIEHTLTCKRGPARCIAFREGTNQVVVGFDRGVVILELERCEREISKEGLDKHIDMHEGEVFLAYLQAPLQTKGLDSTSDLPHLVPSLSPPLITSSQSYTEHQQKVDLDQQCMALAMEILDTKTLNNLVSELTDDNAQHMADFLSWMVDDKVALTQRERKRTLHLLSKLAKSAQVFPQSLELEGVQCDLTKIVIVGGYGFIHKGEYEGRQVCVKVVHADSEGIDIRKMRAQASELIIWAHILHVNVLPFLGIYPSDEEAPRICIVSPWMNNGDLLQYLKKVPDAPRKPLVCDIVSGLQYLHDFDIIHADLKARNVLISETGRAMLTDFGISRLLMTHSISSTHVSAGTAYWMAPELLLGDNEPPTRESDIWAFACTCYEIITGMMPFNQYRILPLLIAAFMRGKITPVKPTPDVGWDEDVWSLALRCWQSDSASRPTAHELLDVINGFNFSDNRFSEPQSYGRRRSSKIDYNRVFSILSKIRQSPTF